MIVTRATIFPVVVLLLALSAGCASPKPRTMLGKESFAILYTTPVKCVARGACVSRVNIRAINGTATQNLTSQYNYQVEPGPLSVIVLAHTVLGDKMKFTQGVCEIAWTAMEGVLYVLNRTIEQDGFLVTAKKNGDVVATCLAEFA